MNLSIVYKFANAINEHNIDKLVSYITEDHLFIDSHENILSGIENIRSGWIGYFQLFPDYYIEINDIFVNGNTYAAFGFASGTYKGIQMNKDENYWRIPAAWKIIFNKNKISLWQVYADTKIPFDNINKSK